MSLIGSKKLHRVAKADLALEKITHVKHVTDILRDWRLHGGEQTDWQANKQKVEGIIRQSQG